MHNKTNKTNKTKTASKTKKDINHSHEFETVSQIQNRYGKGREHSGSEEAVTKGEEAIINNQY
jgi:hypothetical protein